MSVMGSTTVAATSALTALLYRSCQRKTASQTTSGETWSDTGLAFACNYEESSPQQQGALDYSSGAGYGYDVWCKPSQTVAAGDRIVVDGMTFKVLEAAAVGAPGPLKRLRTQRIT